jgi:hypothetical protein
MKSTTGTLHSQGFASIELLTQMKIFNLVNSFSTRTCSLLIFKVFTLSYFSYWGQVARSLQFHITVECFLGRIQKNLLLQYEVLSYILKGHWVLKHPWLHHCLLVFCNLPMGPRITSGHGNHSSTALIHLSVSQSQRSFQQIHMHTVLQIREFEMRMFCL